MSSLPTTGAAGDPNTQTVSFLPVGHVYTPARLIHRDHAVEALTLAFTFTHAEIAGPHIGELPAFRAVLDKMDAGRADFSARVRAVVDEREHVPMPVQCHGPHAFAFDFHGLAVHFYRRTAGIELHDPVVAGSPTQRLPEESIATPVGSLSAPAPAPVNVCNNVPVGLYSSTSFSGLIAARTRCRPAWLQSVRL